MTRRVFIPDDAAALSVGADAVASEFALEAERRGADVTIIRTGSRGMLWLEPLVEIEVDGVRIGYGPVAPELVGALFDDGFLDGGSASPLHIGPVTEHPYFARQTRLTFARCGLTDPLSLSDYEANGGLVGLRKALSMDAEAIIEAVTVSGLRGRGGAGFPTGIKWKTCAEQTDAQKYICCNADEGDSGTFADRMLMEGDPFCLIEGMTIAALAVGASKGFIYLRSEYPHAKSKLERAIALCEQAGLLGENIDGSGRSFELRIRIGAGSYVCGEESAMLDSLEGKRGEVRAKPPIPAISGLFGKPTVVNNVLSFAAAPFILANGGEAYREFGMGRSRGTQPFQLAGNVRQGGLVELAFGVTLGELVHEFGGGTQSGAPVRAVQVGGPLGAYLPPERFDLPMDYEAFLEAGAMIGHGGVVVFDERVQMARQARFAMHFCAEESCGKCTPCRIGAVRGETILDQIIAGDDVAENIVRLDELCEVMEEGSLCAMGGLTPMPVRSALKYWPGDFQS